MLDEVFKPYYVWFQDKLYKTTAITYSLGSDSISHVTIQRGSENLVILHFEHQEKPEQVSKVVYRANVKELLKQGEMRSSA